MESYAVVKAGGKQYRVKPGDVNRNVFRVAIQTLGGPDVDNLAVPAVAANHGDFTG